MEVVPVSVGVASRAWDEQHLDLQAAADQVGGASVAGFTPAVQTAAYRFADTWTVLTTMLGHTCESTADGLRAALRDYVESDEASLLDLLVLRDYLAEPR